MRFFKWMLVGFLVALPVEAAVVVPQSTHEKHPELGIELYYPRAYEAVPIEPNERWVVLHYRQKVKVDRHGRSSHPQRPGLQLLDIPHTPSGEVQARSSSSSSDDDSSNVQVVDIESFFTAQWPAWDLYGKEPGKKKIKGFEAWEYQVVPKDAKNTWQGHVLAWSDENRTVAIFGTSSRGDYRDHLKLWRKVAGKLKLKDPVASEADEKWDRYYAYHGFSRPEYRMEVRASLVKGWKLEDTENFVVTFSTKDEPFMRRVCKHLELLRLEYVKLFPPKAELDAISTVRICKDRGEYIAYGGSSNSNGYWNYTTEELVLYDRQVKSTGERKDATGTLATLYHEAFHQYVFYCAGELSPHSWFNEGYGDYFGGANIKNNKLKSIGVNPWRLRRIQWAFDRGEYASLEDIVGWDQATYYENALVNYAQGWSIVYFLNTSKEVRRHRRWSQILPTYFETLQDAWGDEYAAVSDISNEAMINAAKGRARDAALAAAFEGVQLRELQDAWYDYTESL